MLFLAGLLVIIIGVFLLNKSNNYNKEVESKLNDKNVDHWQLVEQSRSSTHLYVYAMGTIVVGVALMVLYYF